MKFPKLREKGFSLVEVILAVGIAAFSLVAMLALLSVMLGQERVANEKTLTPALTSAIFQKAKQGVAMDGENYAGGELYFSDRGNVLVTAAGALYTCKITPISLSNSGLSGVGNGLLMLRMEIFHTQANQVLKTVYATLPL